MVDNQFITFAKRELEQIGITPTSDDEWCVWMYDHIMLMVQKFSEEGHSGSSATFAADVLCKLLRFKPLTALTGTDDEWVNLGSFGGREGTLYQNKRCSHVFKDDSGAYDSQGKIFRDPNGVCYTNIKSRVPITFPYIPNSIYVDVDFQPNEDF